MAAYLQEKCDAEISEHAEILPSAQMLMMYFIYHGPGRMAASQAVKTNLLQALSCLISSVVKPIHDLEKTRESFVMQHRISCSPFLFDDDSRNQSTEFQIFFRQGTNEYRYYLSLLNDEVISESLYWKAIGGEKTGTVFEREKDEITLGASISKAGINRSVNPKMPYLS